MNCQNRKPKSLGDLTDDEAVEEMARRSGRLCGIWDKARAGAEVASPTFDNALLSSTQKVRGGRPAPVAEASHLHVWLAPSQRSEVQRGRRHKLLTDWARQGALQICRWLPGRDIVFVGDSSSTVHELASAITGRATLISRLRLDANLLGPPPKRRCALHRPPGAEGRAITVIEDPALKSCYAVAQNNRIRLGHGPKQEKTLEITS